MLASHYGFAGLHAIYAIIFGLFVFYAQIDHQRELSLQSELTFQRKLTARQKAQYEINEAPLSVLRSESGLLDSVNGTVPVYIFKRVAGEGRDMPRSMYNHADSAEDQARSYLEPDSTEREILQYLDDNYDDVILVLNSNAAIDLDWVKEYPSIKAIINAPDGLLALGDVLTGAVNPSGRTVDTFAADALRSPAAQNFGDYQYSNADGSLTKYNYVTYEEGIYVGYRYYETRYEDVVLGQGNAGDFDYDAEVIYPFGYGLSYTTFDWTNFGTVWNGDTCTVTVDHRQRQHRRVHVLQADDRGRSGHQTHQ